MYSFLSDVSVNISVDVFTNKKTLLYLIWKKNLSRLLNITTCTPLYGCFIYYISLLLRISRECMKSRDLFMEGNRTVIRKYCMCIGFFKVIKNGANDIFFHLLKMFQKICHYSQ